MTHSHSSMEYGKAFAIGIALNTIYVIVEFAYGFSVDSTALMADAGHNAGDVFGLILAWAAMWLAGQRPSKNYTYGFRKATILASMFNGIILIFAAGFIVLEAVKKFSQPADVPGITVFIVAAMGLVVNTGTAFLFFRDRKSDLNIQGAFLHMAADAGVTLGVLLGGLAIMFTGATWIDPVLGLIIVVVIAYSTWGLLSESVRLALDGVPEDIDHEQVRLFLEGLKTVKEVHDLHIWALSTTEVALTAHLIIPEEHDDQLLYEIREGLYEKFKITHTTLQIEKNWGDQEYRACHD